MTHVLIVEDEHLIARLIEMSLTRAGYDCTVAGDGRTAADLIEANTYDLLNNGALLMPADVATHFGEVLA